MKQMIKAGDDWTFEKLEWIYNEIEKINNEKYQLNIFPNIIEVITYEQMLDRYSRIGMPTGYDHWSYGERFIKDYTAYKNNFSSLAFEIVVNTCPCINYLMENNSMLMQAIVIAHAAMGHNSFFANNFYFKEWTDPEGIISTLEYSKNYVKECEEKYGPEEVEKTLNAARALSGYGADRFKRNKALTETQEDKKKREREEYLQSQVNELWKLEKNNKQTEKQLKFPEVPESNILYFIQKNAPKLKPWQRELIRIVRKDEEYLRAQIGTQNGNEGFATFFHYSFINDLYNKELMDDGAYQEFLDMHTMVITQRDGTGNINPYALGFAIYKDIERISLNPTQEDKDWFRGQDWVGNNDPIGNIKFAAYNFKDDSFILQYLSPKVIRDFKFYTIKDDAKLDYYLVEGIHNEEGYKIVRNNLAKNYDIENMIPEINIVDVDIYGNRSMTLRYLGKNGKELHEQSMMEVMEYIEYLWGYPIFMEVYNDNKFQHMVGPDNEENAKKFKDFSLSDLT